VNSKPVTSWRQRHRFHQYRILGEWQTASASQGCDATGGAGDGAVNSVAAAHADYYRQTIEAAATVMAIKTRMAFVGDIASTEREILATAQDPGASLIIGPDAFTFANRHQIAQLANSAKVPAIYPLTSYAAAGGLLSYGIDLPDLHRRAAMYIDRILKGAKPADLPVQLPTKFELAVNLKTAKLLGIAIPDKLIAIADEVIE
jgi:putative tryptophan/tyrosine transport system substrate-binding protein